MRELINNMTATDLCWLFGGLLVLQKFGESLIMPVVRKWLKIEKQENDLTTLRGLPDRVEILEAKANNDFKRLNSIDDVNVLMMEALRALIVSRRTGNNVENLKVIEDKIDGFLVGRIRS